MQKSNKQIKLFLEEEYQRRNCLEELCLEKPDPLLIAKKYNDEYIALICALFAYGNASQIVKFLLSIDFNLLEKKPAIIEQALAKHYYRFQNSQDVISFFQLLAKLYRQEKLEDIFIKGYLKNHNVIDGIKELVTLLYDSTSYRSKGFEFLIGKIPQEKNTTPYKRWNMYLRWMVRDDNLDLGLWKRVEKKDLLLPLDTHTFKVSQKLGLLKRKSYDFKAVLEITEMLKKFDKNDPIKYDFVLYRLGQEMIIL